MIFNGTHAWDSGGESAQHWNDTVPTTELFGLGTSGNVNGSGATYIGYIWAEVEGYSKFGKYAGTGAEGHYIYCGFRPAYILIKGYDFAGESWFIFDSKRDPQNEADERLLTNVNLASNEDQDLGDIMSNGFRIMNGWDGINGSSKNYIFAAFAEFPLKYSRAR